MLTPLRLLYSSHQIHFNHAMLVAGIICLLCIFSSSISARPVADLNVSFAPLSSQSPAAINQAKRQALGAVLVKMSGSENVLTHPNINMLLSNADRYIESSRFVDQPDDGLKVIFDNDLLEKWLKQQRLPLWGAMRPTATLWLSVESVAYNTPTARTLLGDGSVHPLVSTMTKLTQARGIYINLPLLDLDDLTQVSELDVWGLFATPIAEATLRYQTEYALAAKVFVNSDMMWQLEGMIMTVDERVAVKKVRRYRYIGMSSEQVLNEFLSFYVNQIATEDAIDTSRFANNDFLSTMVEVTDIVSIEDIIYARQHLEELSMVNAAEHVSQQGDKARFKLTLLSDPQRLIEALTRAGKLIVTSREASVFETGELNQVDTNANNRAESEMREDDSPVLQFRWQP